MPLTDRMLSPKEGAAFLAEHGITRGWRSLSRWYREKRFRGNEAKKIGLVTMFRPDALLRVAREMEAGRGDGRD